MVGKRGASRGESSGPGGSGGPGGSEPRPRPLPAALAARLAHALVAHMLAADTCSHADALMLAAKVCISTIEIITKGLKARGYGHNMMVSSPT